MLTTNSDKKLFLLDAFALIYRAYFAFSKNPRINSKGMNTSAIFGFVNTLIDVINKEKPTHLAVVFDPPSPPDRTKAFADYKANREDTPEDIKQSVPYIMAILKAWDIPVLMADGYEADDVIGTLSIKAEEEGFITYMMTPDKDFGQLVTDKVFMYKPARMGNAAEVWGIEEVCKKFEIENTKQVIDILGLWGDAVDNIPGVPGIGEKTAKKLVGKYGSMENLYNHVDDLKGKQKENVINFKEQAFLSKELATIIIDAPVEFKADDLKMSKPNEGELNELFTELEFRRLSEKILGKPVESAPPSSGSDDQMSLFGGSETIEESDDWKTLANTTHEYKLVKENFGDLIQALSSQEAFCFDTETTSVDSHTAELVGIAFSWEQGKAFYVPISEDRATAQQQVNQFKAVLESDKHLKIGHNIKYDINVLKNYNVRVSGPLFDTMVAHYILESDNNRRSMDVLAETCLGYKPQSITELIGKKGKNQKSMRDVPVEEVVEYAGEDADITWQLYQYLKPKVEEGKSKELFYNLEMPLIEVLSDMEMEGIRLDAAQLDQYAIDLGEEIKSIEQKIYESAGMEFKISSPKQVGEVLFDRLKVTDKPKKTKTGQYATNEEALQSLAGKHPIINEILEYREVVKLRNTYVKPLPELINEQTGRIHTSFNQVVAATGRLSSDKPNLQNIPIRTERGRKIREAFVPRSEEYTLLSADYSQIELRIIAALSEDEGMLEAFRKGIDIHSTTASKVYGVSLDEVTREMRSNAKTVNFGIIYGISAFGLSQRINISRKEAKEIIDNYFDQFPSIKAYMDESIATAKEQGYVETVLGRRRYLRDINSANSVVRGFAERNAINSPIQGSAADLIKKAMILVYEELIAKKLKSKLVLQVHDELIVDVHNSEKEEVSELVQRNMSNAFDLGVPLEVEYSYGANWLEAH
jgi:DNA polymerase-1